jgi:uncharacterized membrane protein YeaQ/YmgE (transglycosylase-associated protein family)
MTLGLFLMWVVVGGIAGWLAGYVMRSGGYGLKGDLILGLVGSIVGSWLFWALRVSPDAGPVVLVLVAFIGAAIALVVQRKFWFGYA